MARIKTSPEDFVVDEIPAYEPSGEGDHLFVRFRKRGRNTNDVVGEMARALGIQPRDVGVAGLKDKVGITTQTISLPRKPELETRLAALSLSDVTIEEAKWHRNKLKTGHLKGNRFTIVVREVTDVPRALAAFHEIAKLGVPNAFGAQRFGFDGRNVERAEGWLSDREPPPRDPKARRFSFSAWQSHLFNQVLEARLAQGTWASVVEGDLLMKHLSGGLFVCTDVQTDEVRAATGEVSATGPMIGSKMRWPEGAARKLEEDVVRPALQRLGVGPAEEAHFLERLASLGEGTRRPLRQWVTELLAEALPSEPGAVRVQFVLPSGAYATTVVARAIPEIASESEVMASGDGASSAPDH